MDWRIIKLKLLALMSMSLNVTKEISCNRNVLAFRETKGRRKFDHPSHKKLVKTHSPRNPHSTVRSSYPSHTLWTFSLIFSFLFFFFFFFFFFVLILFLVLNFFIVIFIGDIVIVAIPHWLLHLSFLFSFFFFFYSCPILWSLVCRCFYNILSFFLSFFLSSISLPSFLFFVLICFSPFPRQLKS